MEFLITNLRENKKFSGKKGLSKKEASPWKKDNGYSFAEIILAKGGKLTSEKKWVFSPVFYCFKQYGLGNRSQGAEPKPKQETLPVPEVGALVTSVW